MTNGIHREGLLSVQNLSIAFRNNSNFEPVVKDLNLTIRKGEVVGLVGESGSGKSVTALTIAGLLHSSAKVQVHGQVIFNTDGQAEYCQRTRKVGMIFQDPFDSLNPAFTVGYQIQEVFRAQQGLKKRQAWQKAVEMLEKVKISSPARVAAQYPHQLSGGMCQRVMIAIALASEPALLIADEPTTALDVTIQAQILQLLYEQHRNTRTSILFITHDFGVVAQLCNSVAIMLEGEIVEQGPTTTIFKHPQHPYTKGLLNSIPLMGRKKRLEPMVLSGDMDKPRNGCGYYPRCPIKGSACRSIRPPLRECNDDYFLRCIADNGEEP